MRNIIYLLVVLYSVFFVSCQKESYVAKFDEPPQDRIEEQVELVKNTLIQAPNGWIGTLSTGLGGGYGFYMTFDANEFVNMYADLTNAAATTVKQSQYRIKADMGADLIFDTYTYISLLNDPTPSVFGGSGRDGFKSDVEFIYDHSTSDSIVFIGKRYRQWFSLVKATAEQKAKYTDGSYLTAINNFKQFFADNSNAYITLSNGTKVSVEANGDNSLEAGKRITLSAVNTDGSITSVTGKFAYTIDKMVVLDSSIKIDSVSFESIAWKNTTTLALYSTHGQEYVLQNSISPILPLYKLLGVKYTGVWSPFKTILPGTSEAGADILNFFHNHLNDGYTGFVFNYGEIDLEWNTLNQRVTLIGFSSQDGGSSGWTTTSTYTYEVDNNGVYTFTLNSNFSGGYVSTILVPFQNFLLNNKVKFDYYIDGSDVYAQMISVTDPTITMTLELY